jgi:sulfur-oxidizing protein SoxY
MSEFTVSRRGVLAGAGVGIVAAAGLGLMPRNAMATPDQAAAMIKKVTGGAAIKSGKVTLKMPEIAENGASVPFTVTVDSPMTDKDYVKKIYVIADDNPFPEVADYELTPAMGKAEVSMRMRLAKTQKVHAIAIMSDGSTYQATQTVKVTIGGCGG